MHKEPRLTPPRHADVLIIGAGAIGCSIALELANRGAGRIVIIDRGAAGEGSSSRAAGGLREQFSTGINVRFSQLSMPVFRNAEEVLGGSICYQETGYIFLARSDQQADAFRRNVEMQRNLGVDAHWMSPDNLERHWPYLQLDGVVAGSWCPTDALIDQVQYMELLVARARDAGVTFHEGVTATSLILDGGAVVGADTSAGRMLAGVTVLAAGVWSPEIASSIDVDLPVSANRREI